MTFTAGNKDLASIYKVGAALADELVGQALDAGINFFGGRLALPGSL